MNVTIEPGIKIAAQMPPEPSDDDFLLVNQMGVDHAVVWTREPDPGPEYFASRKARFEESGVNIYGFGNSNVHNQDALVLNLPNRAEKLEEYKSHLRSLGAAGIPYTTYAHMANGVWSTDPGETRGDARARIFDLDAADKSLSHEREYTEDEIWKNFESFIQEAAPVAEEAGVKIGIHPDDPPGPSLGGVPRCIFSSFDGFKRAMEIADSPNVGLCLCAGCWLEGGEKMGKDVLETIRYFGERRKIFKVHFRNVDTPLPKFKETFLDDGYMDMYKIMKALKEVEFDGVVIPDHIPAMVNGHGTAYTIGYMNALLQRANEEVGS